MILVTGGLGFLGAHTTRALLDLGERCVVARRGDTPPPALLADALDGPLAVERLDVTDADALLALGDRYDITGIVHLAASGLGGADVVADLRAASDALYAVLAAASAWRVPRVCVASSIGVYAGVPGTVLREDAPLPVASPHLIPAAKKSGEIIGGLVAARTDLEVVALRIGAVWGPLGRAASPFFAAPALVHAAVRGTPAPTAYAGDGIDMCYAADCGRAVALLQTAATLRHGVYNVASGRITTNAEVAAAVRAAVPDAGVELAGGRAPHAPAADAHLDLARLTADTGYRPEYDVTTGVADYAAWLRAGHPR